MNKKKRLFVAVNFPEETKKKIAEIMELIPKEKWRKPKPENIHITIAFLGWLDAKTERKAVEAMEKLSDFGEFEIELNGFGHFDGRVLWAGVGKGADELNLLSRKLNSLLGTKHENFHSHITLARNRGAKRKDANELVEKLRRTGFRETITGRGIELMESHLQKAGPVYKKVFTVGFQDKELS